MRKKALSKFLNCQQSQIHINEFRDGYYYNGADYAVFTEEEANKEAAKNVVYHIGTLDIDFIISYLPAETDQVSLKELLNKGCDNCFNLVSLFIKNYDHFISESIHKYGRAYFICLGGKTEYSIQYENVIYYIYRLV